MALQMPNACLPCAAKKRKCDRAFPKCGRCSRLKINQDCVYRAPFEDHLLNFNSGHVEHLSITSRG
ncbi:hypothetical protein BDW68DRAFT_164479 [Aspergillus falconensis]